MSGVNYFNHISSTDRHQVCYMCSAGSLNNIFEMNVLEGISLPLEDNQSGYLKLNHYDIIMEKVEWAI